MPCSALRASARHGEDGSRIRVAARDLFEPRDSLGAALLGIGTAMVYPTLLAAIGDVAYPSWRAQSVGVYRLWRDLGYAIGALISGLVADALGLSAAMWLVAALTCASGVLVAVRMVETRRRREARVPVPSGEPKRGLG